MQMLPGKKGISLTKEQAAKLVAAITELSTALAEKQEKTVTLGPLYVFYPPGLCNTCSSIIQLPLTPHMAI